MSILGGKGALGRTPIETERAGAERTLLKRGRLLESYTDRLADQFVVVTESRVRFACA